MSSHFVDNMKTIAESASGGTAKVVIGLSSLAGSIGVAEKIVPVVVPVITCIFFILSVLAGIYFKAKESDRLQRIADETVENLKSERRVHDKQDNLERRREEDEN